MARPQVKVGDIWTYNRLGRMSNVKSGRSTTRVLKFPLRVGHSYPVVYETKAPRAGTGAAHLRHERTAKVVGWEEVQVPAGKFRALKIEVSGTFYRIDAGFSGTAKDVIWYAPSVKRWVKQTYEDSTPRGAYSWSGEELISYKLK